MYINKNKWQPAGLHRQGEKMNTELLEKIVSAHMLEIEPRFQIPHIELEIQWEKENLEDLENELEEYLLNLSENKSNDFEIATTISMLLARIDESKNKIANLTGELSRMNAEWETRRETLHNLIEELKKS